jgi:hypothetical protein
MSHFVSFAIHYYTNNFICLCVLYIYVVIKGLKYKDNILIDDGH